MREAGEEDGEWNERFVVRWIEVEVEAQAEGVVRDTKPQPVVNATRKGPTGVPGVPRSDIGIGMGSREERRSFGSDATTIRTALPIDRGTSAFAQTTLRPNQSRPEPPTRATPEDSCHRGPQARLGGLNTTMPNGGESSTTSLEWQLIAITFGGDWYRLRVPNEAGAEDDGVQAQKKTGRKCELVEYRRLNVGGGGW
jgi:hypothetical protein